MAQFSDPKGQELLAELAGVFRQKPVFHRKERHIVFVCGGTVAENSTSKRQQFLNWASSELPNAVLILAEAAYKATEIYDPPQFINLSKFETFIGEVSDCIIIFPESAGSFAEIGLFSHIPAIRNKTLVANDSAYQGHDSFTNLGPIATFDSHSFLRPALHINVTKDGIDFSPVKERLNRLLKRTYRRKLEYRPYKELDYRQKFPVVFETIRILRAVSIMGLHSSLTKSFGKTSLGDLRYLLSVMRASRYITIRNDHYVPEDGLAPLLEFDGIEIEDLVARATYYHERHGDANAERSPEAGYAG